MATNAGIWIDHNQATVVLVSETGRQIKALKASSEVSLPAAGSRGKKKYTPNDFIAEDKRDRKVANERKEFYDDVITQIRGAAAVLILGPGEAKAELNKRLRTKKIRGVTVGLEASGKITGRQLVAKVEEHFNQTPDSKPAVATRRKRA